MSVCYDNDLGSIYEICPVIEDFGNFVRISQRPWAGQTWHVTTFGQSGQSGPSESQTVTS